jgi:hypothetical protein
VSYPASPDQAPPGALLDGELVGGSVLPLGPRDVVAVHGPAVVVGFDVSLAHLAVNGVSIEAVITAAKVAVAAIVNEAAPGATVDAADLIAAALAVPGVASVRFAYFGAGPSVSPVDGSWTVPMSTYVLGATETDYLLASSVDARDVRIVP